MIQSYQCDVVTGGVVVVFVGGMVVGGVVVVVLAPLRGVVSIPVMLMLVVQPWFLAALAVYVDAVISRSYGFFVTAIVRPSGASIVNPAPLLLRSMSLYVLEKLLLSGVPTQEPATQLLLVLCSASHDMAMVLRITSLSTFAGSMLRIVTLPWVVYRAQVALPVFGELMLMLSVPGAELSVATA